MEIQWGKPSSLRQWLSPRLRQGFAEAVASVDSVDLKSKFNGDGCGKTRHAGFVFGQTANKDGSRQFGHSP